MIPIFWKTVTRFVKNWYLMVHFSKVTAILLLIIIFIGCKDKDKVIQDYAWQEESLKMAGEVCLKIKDCGLETGAFQGLNANQAKLVEKRLTEASCKDYHRTTNAFLLKGEEPEIIKANSRNCHQLMLTLDCQDLVKKKYLEFPSCVALGKIQQFR